MIKKILFISNDIGRKESGGKSVSIRNFNLLKQISKNVTLFSFRRKKVENFKKNIFFSYIGKLKILFKNILLYSGNLDKYSEKKILDLIQQDKYNMIFFDSSLLGRVIFEIKKNFYHVDVITFFHNVEFLYYKARVKFDGFIYWPLVMSSYYNEMLAVKYSDKLIVLNKRDNDMLFRIYKRKADYILPVTIKDRFNMEKYTKQEKTSSKNITYLFVGSYFFANVEGIMWFIKKVMPFLPGKLQIVGKGMESLRKKVNASNIEVIGGVENIDDYYYNANFVISPIFSGSGMKVKIAEALMFGKTIFATKESFYGYDIKYGEIGEECNSAEEFILKIKQYIYLGKVDKFNEKSRNLYKKKYSFNVSLIQMKDIFDKLGKS